MQQKKPPKLKKLKRPWNKRRLKNDYANYKRAFKKKFKSKFKLKKVIKAMLTVMLFIVGMALFLAFFFNEFYHKQTFNHSIWLPCFFAMCCLLVQIRYFIKQGHLPILDGKLIKKAIHENDSKKYRVSRNRTNRKLTNNSHANNNHTNKKSLWDKTQIVLLNLIILLFVGYVFGVSGNTLFTQIAGSYQPSKTYTIIDKQVDSGSRYTDYEIYLADNSAITTVSIDKKNIDDLSQQRKLSLSRQFYNRVAIGDSLVLTAKCSVLSCYVAEEDMVIVENHR